MITGLGYTRKDKVFAEFDIEGSHYTFKESHSSKKGLYKIGIYSGNEKVYNIYMGREQINRIKDNKGIAGINFLSEEGFKHWIEETYINREFDPKRFNKHFQGWFINRFDFLQDKGYFKNSEVDYVSYLVSEVPESLLESLYRENKIEFSKTFKYNELYITSDQETEVFNKYKDMIDGIKREVEIYLNQHGIDYMSIEEFQGSVEQKEVRDEYKKWKDKRDAEMRNI